MLALDSRGLSRLRALEGWLYPLWAALCTLLSARKFYRYMLLQTAGEWSAPLDDVFIHFDYARATAQGAPFQWVIGNGYSSGNTSVTYPFVLALGYRLGFHGNDLMQWAAIVACVSVFCGLLLSRRFFKASNLPRLVSYLLPPLVLAVGALDWSFWSGMEVALFFGLYALAADRMLAFAHGGPARVPYWQLVSVSVLLFFTRPEALAVNGCFAVYIATHTPHPRRLKVRLTLWLRVFAPTVCAFVLQSTVNKLLTGEYSASGALVKLAVYNPHVSTHDKLADYIFNARYAIQRNIEYHFADDARYCMLLPLMGLLPLAFQKTRSVALLLWAQILTWVLLLGLNGQVRWQNERYTMPAVAWLLVLAALGIGALVTAAPKPQAKGAFVVLWLAATGFVANFHKVEELYPLSSTCAWGALLALGAVVALYIRPLRIVAACVMLVLFVQHQEPKMRGQKWFFGRASRNIRDQQTTLGRYLAEGSGAASDAGLAAARSARTQNDDPLPDDNSALTPEPPRVLVGDAGAIIYASGWRGLDAIGLGGYHDLPFARAGAEGLASVVELIERMPAHERPAYMAIFPSWWGILPLWFSSGIIQRFPIEGNVICGDYEHVLYKADWHLLGTGETLTKLPQGTTQVRDTVDLGDLVDEKAHHYDWAPHADNGWTTQRILPTAEGSSSEMWDGGRRISEGHVMSFTLGHLIPGRAMSLVMRIAPERVTAVSFAIGSYDSGKVVLPRSLHWVEYVVQVPATNVTQAMPVVVHNQGPEDFAIFHVFATQ